MTGTRLLLCASCGRQLSNDPAAPNAALWTLFEPRMPHCADQSECGRDVTTAWLRIAP